MYGVLAFALGRSSGEVRSVCDATGLQDGPFGGPSPPMANARRLFWGKPGCLALSLKSARKSEAREKMPLGEYL